MFEDLNLHDRNKKKSLSNNANYNCTKLVTTQF